MRADNGRGSTSAPEGNPPAEKQKPRKLLRIVRFGVAPAASLYTILATKAGVTTNVCVPYGGHIPPDFCYFFNI